MWIVKSIRERKNGRGEERRIGCVYGEGRRIGIWEWIRRDRGK